MQTIANALHGCSLARVRPPPSVVIDMVRWCVAHIDTCKRKELSSLMLSCSQLRVTPPVEDVELLLQALRHTPQSGEQAVSSSLYATASMFKDNADALRRLKPLVLQLVEDTTMTRHMLTAKQCNQLLIAHHVYNDVQHLGPLLSEDLVMYCAAIGQHQLAVFQPRNFGRDVAEVAQGMELFSHVEHEVHVLEGITAVDVLCTMEGDDGVQHHVVLEADGPLHFFSNLQEEPMVDGRTDLKHTLLRAVGHKVVPVHWKEWDGPWKSRDVEALQGLIKRGLEAEFHRNCVKHS